ncbi:cullin-like protein, putative [Plasmodium berghei]|uniref:Cullin-like protein, putative n=2 Tax=Plasmodium berghei TaxID=5821 RepID=A0A509AKV8_PLABA|nr:cullin-like protein, putative [Plasmodium berghei ANKA]CXI65995.1 cullin-like protein, putative [Plasmodium berghei]SCM24001.1 cullin-like protein, putative [Plasmodium berghei]SCN26877.1 cullin-like protein, putative [Plasmodium berghei]SCO61279.1 cullin-like protein, putative [Plasmodium berghei]SCO63298.1 cullin-like protein, putative [Plasmodium berghei]|eukprot:XP_034422493.1 cullin-like protein, putative [Plasmodium berghei ANKA]
MDPSAFKNFPVFYIKNKENVNIDNDQFSSSLRKFEEYIQSCFDFLPFKELKIDSENIFIIKNLFDFFVFYDCDRLICETIENKCKDKTIAFFEDLETKINNNEFKNAETFLNYYVHIWNNFSLVIVHLEDILESFNSYNKITSVNFDTPSYIFTEIWKKYTHDFTKIKNIIISSASEYLKWDKIFCETKFYQYVCMDIYNNENAQNMFINIDNKNINNIKYEQVGIDKCINYSHENCQIDKTNEINPDQKENQRNVINYNIEKDNTNVYIHSSDDELLLNNIFKKENNNNFVCKENATKINEKLLSTVLRIIDILGMYEEFEKVYKNETYEYFKNRVKKSNKMLINEKNKIIDNRLYNFPNELENYLCHEQMRCRKFLKEETEIAILNMLKELLIVNHKDILYQTEYIDYCIINEKYDSLRILYLFSLNLNITEEFCNLFCNSVETIGVDLINNLINNRNNVNILNDKFIQLINFKLNIDRIIIMSFRYSYFFTKKWKEVLEHILNKGDQADKYMPIILSIYLNNLMMMYNACINKLRKYYILNKEIKNKTYRNNISNPHFLSNTDSVGVVERESNQSSDSKGDQESGIENDNELNNQYSYSDYDNSENGDKIYIHYHAEKAEKLFKMYQDVGKCIMSIVTIVLSLFKYISDKEKFEKYYRIFMCKRLINDNSFNIVLDIKVFKTLKKECGQQFTKKIESILKDMKITSKIVKRFYNEMPHNSIKLLKKKKYFVNIIFNETWDYNKLENSVIYPESVKMCNDFFLKYYKRYNKSKNITFLPLFGLCTLKVNFSRITKKKEYSRWQAGILQLLEKNDSNKNSAKSESDNDIFCKKKKKKIYITVTIIQALCLLQFNKNLEYTINELCDMTGISIDNILCYLKSIYTDGETQILIYDEINKKFKVNSEFKSKKKHLVVDYADTTYRDNTNIPALTQENMENEDISLHIDAAIVKFLKVEGKASQMNICEYIKKKKNISSNEQITNRISSLVNREFIFFQNDLYHYEL